MNNPSAPYSFTAVDEEGNVNHGEKNGEAQKHHLQFFNFHFCHIQLHAHLCDLFFLKTLFIELMNTWTSNNQQWLSKLFPFKPFWKCQTTNFYLQLDCEKSVISYWQLLSFLPNLLSRYAPPNNHFSSIKVFMSKIIQFLAEW